MKINWDDSEIRAKFESLKFEQMEHIYRDALRDALRPEANQIIPALQRQFKTHNGFLKWSGNRAELKWSTRFDNGSSTYTGKIFIVPNGALKWFEQGTQERFRKNGASTGQLKPSYVFNGLIDPAMQAALQTAMQKIDTSLQQEFDK